VNLILACGSESVRRSGGPLTTDASMEIAPVLDASTVDSGELRDDLANGCLEKVNQVDIETSLGLISIELDPVNAPKTVENFLRYVDEGFYDGTDGKEATVFHRVLSGFMIQGGGLTESGSRKQTHSSIELESNNGLSNIRGAVAMARTPEPNSATSQFFINHIDNLYLDYQSASDPGYAAFGKVVVGLDVVDAIARVTTNSNGLPNTPILLVAVSRSKKD